MNQPISSDTICSEDKDVLETQFESAREDLKRLVASMLDRRLAGRVDPSDIVQETYVDAIRRYPEYLLSREVPLIDWLRFLAAQSVKATYRFHIGRQKRDVNCEKTNIAGSSFSQSIVEMLSSSQTTPQTAALRAELRLVVEQKLEGMSSANQEIYGCVMKNA